MNPRRSSSSPAVASRSKQPSRGLRTAIRSRRWMIAAAFLWSLTMQRAESAESAGRPTATAAAPAADEQARREAFGKKIDAFEKQEVEALWVCLFGPKGVQRIWPQSALQLALDSQYEEDPRGFPAKVLKQCVPVGTQVVKKVPGLSPPAALAVQVARYGQALQALVAAIKEWAEKSTEQQAELFLSKQAIKASGRTWSEVTDAKNATPLAWQYDRFLHCALPGLDQLPDSGAVLALLARKCPKRQRADVQERDAFLKLLRETCLPQVRTAQPKAPVAFAATHQKLAAVYFDLRDVLAGCLTGENLLNREPQSAANRAQEDWVHAKGALL